jgi:hypothetical protein
MLTQLADSSAWLADFIVLASEHEPPTFDYRAQLVHGITTGLSPIEAAENDKHL